MKKPLVRRSMRNCINRIKRAALIPLSAIIISCSPMLESSQNIATVGKQEVNDRQKLIGFLLKKLKNGNKKERLDAAIKLGELKDKKTAQEITVIAIGEQNEKVLEEIVDTLGKIKDPSACTLLVYLACARKSLYIRWKAIKALEKIGGTNAYDALQEIINSGIYKIIKEPAREAQRRVGETILGSIR